MPITLTPAQLNCSEAAQWWQIVKQSLDDVRVSTPAFLTEDMDPVTQTVTAQIAISERVRTAKGAQWTQIAPIIMVPVVVPRGGGFSLTLPLKKGDEGMLVFCDTCFDYWWKYGAYGGSGSRPQLEVRRHHVHDCGFLPGMWSQPNVLTDYSTTSVQLRSDDGAVSVSLTPDSVALSADSGATTVSLTPSGIVMNTSGSLTMNAASVAADDGGASKFLVNDTFFQWYVTNIQPFLVSKGYTGPALPAGCETTILKGQ